jgi:mannose-6-phosphate isomerase-like protein (cupin superfamily)
MSNVVSIQNAEHYTWGAKCDRWFLLKEENMHVIQERMPAGTAEKSHYHKRSRQFFYVLRGELTIEVAREALRMREGEGLEIAPGAVHQARNNSNKDAEFFVVSCPPIHDDRMNLE